MNNKKNISNDHLTTIRKKAKGHNCGYFVCILTDKQSRGFYEYIVLLSFLLCILFTLYPADSRVIIGNLVLRHSVPHFSPRSGGHCVLSSGTHRRTLLRHQR